MYDDIITNLSIAMSVVVLAIVFAVVAARIANSEPLQSAHTQVKSVAENMVAQK